MAGYIELAHWAERHERDVYEKLDSISVQPDSGMPSHLRFEGVLWLQSIKFKKNDSPIAPLRLLMIDDLHKLRRKQRELLISELTELRPSIPIWLAERNIALGKELLSQGARLGRDINVISLDQLWNSNRGAHQFSAYAQNILDRRLKKQHTVPSTSFTVHLRSEIQGSSHLEEICSGIDRFKEVTAQFKTNPQYGEWFSLAEEHLDDTSIESLKELFTLRILIARNEEKRQLSLEFTPLPSEELASRDSSQLQGAAEIFMHEEQGLPYYFGIDRLCVMSTTNVEELLSLSAALYDGILNKIVLRKPEHSLLAQEQDRILTDFARAKHDNIPKSHTQGTRAQTLLDSIGTFCRERTFKPSAPIAPGVTGIRLTRSEMNKLYEAKGSSVELTGTLHEVLAECVAENLLTIRASAESTGREEGTVFYLNRTLCAAYGLPIQYGGWQAITVRNLVSWMDKKYIPPSTKYGKLDF